MSILNNSLLLGADAGAAGYEISRSLRFNSSDSAYCSRTFSSVGTSLTTATLSMWVKRSALASDYTLFSAGTDASDYLIVNFNSSDILRIFTGENGSTNNNLLTSTRVFRDTSAWYHILIQFDWSNSTTSDRVKLYVNGERDTLTGTFANQNYTNTRFNRAFAHSIGKWSTNVNYFSGYIADIHFIDGQALTPSSFTEVSATTGRLEPKQYAGTFGTNGFWLKFSDNSAATATTLGKDYSGNSNNWTPNNLSVTAGAGNDSLTDTPTSYGTDDSLGGSVRGNYATLNPLDKANIGSAVLSNGNLDYNSTSGGNRAPSTIGVSSGKWYMEMTANTSGNASWTVGVIDSATGSIAVSYYAFDGKIYPAGTTYGNTYTAGDVIGVALDLDNGKIFFSKNGTWQNSGNPTTGTNPAASSLSGTYAFFVGHGSGASTSTSTANFGQRQWAYQAPAGFRPLVDTCLPAPVVAKSSDYFQTVLYTGNGGTQTITTGLSPDFVWVKKRNTAANHYLADTVRGTTKALLSDVTDAEYTSANYITAFNSDGFSVGSDSGYNTSSHTYVAWAWDAGTTTTTNTAGSITSQVRANPSAGFSVVTGTGNGTAGHGLNVKPSLILVKSRTTAGNWGVYTSALGNTQFLRLNTTDAAGTSSTVFPAEPTSTVFSLGSGMVGSTENWVAYCFSPVAGYSSMGSYVGNGSSDGTFVYTGFRPRFVLIKRTDSTSQWAIKDSTRDTYNVATQTLLPNLSNAEETNRNVDLLSNGFKWRGTDQDSNVNGGTFIYLAIAESPFQYARAR